MPKCPSSVAELQRVDERSPKTEIRNPRERGTPCWRRNLAKLSFVIRVSDRNPTWHTIGLMSQKLLNAVARKAASGLQEWPPGFQPAGQLYRHETRCPVWAEGTGPQRRDLWF